MYVDVHYLCKKSYYSHNVVIAGYQVILFFMFLENTVLLIYLFLAEAHRSTLPAVEAQRVNHWNTRKVLKLFLFSSLSLSLFFLKFSLPMHYFFSTFFILKFFKPSESCKSSTMNHSLSTFSPCWIKLKITQCSILNATGQIYWKQGHSLTQTQYHYKDLVLLSNMQFTFKHPQLSQ